MVFKISHAAVVGTDHLLRGIPCQDRIRFFQAEDVLCVALADGAGSRSASHLGAEAVTEALSQYICEHFSRLYRMTPEDLVAELLEQCYRALSALPYELPELASTLLFFAADTDGNCITGHLGDGVMLMEQQEKVRLYSPPENADEPNTTWFTTSRDAGSHFRIRKTILPETGAMMLLSDGGAVCLYNPATGQIAKACQVLLRWHREDAYLSGNAMLQYNLEQKFSQHTADDLSIALISW